MKFNHPNQIIQKQDLSTIRYSIFIQSWAWAKTSQLETLDI